MFSLCKKCGQPTPSKTRKLCDNCIPHNIRDAIAANVGKKHSQEFKDNLSRLKTGKKLPAMTQARKDALAKARMGKSISHSEETKAKMSKTRKGKPHSPEHNKAISEAKKGKPRPDVAFRHLNNPRYIRKHYISKAGQNITFRSSWEYKVAVYLDDLDIKWIYEFDVIILDNVSYLPDFFIFDDFGNWIKIIEVKGWFKPGGKEKLQKFQEALIDLDVELEIWDGDKLIGLGLL